MPKIQNIHDKYFKSVFSRKDIALDTLRMLIDEKHLEMLDLKTFCLSNASFIDEKLKENFADLVYECQTKDSHSIQISFIYEHKSFVEPFPHLQLLRYMINVWEENKKQNQPLRLLIPIVFYHGQETWNYVALKTYFNWQVDDYQEFIPEFKYLLFNLSVFSNEEIESFENKFLAVSSLILKNVQRKKYYLKILNNFVSLFDKIESDKSFVKTTILYLLQTNDLDENEFFIIFEKQSNKIHKTMLSIYDRAIQKGELIGEHRGELRGELRGEQKGKEQAQTLAKIKIVESSLKLGFSKKVIVEQLKMVFDISNADAIKIFDDVSLSNQ